MPVNTVARSLFRGLFALSLGVAAISAHAQNMVSISGSTVNMRDGPSLQSTVLWELRRGFPLQVTERRGNWLEVKDFEGDTGWVARSLTGDEPHHIVTSKILNVRSGPGLNNEVVVQAQYGELLKTLEKRGDWVRVERETGESGWVSERLVWGW
ncbi:SH3 domain-containing protein [Hydrogenophaga sp. YM1]|jgi:SH3-like domain-containing protein|uniref:SH3 domain-containing protein n=1 Tax=Hydrogenophaga TaxID=47420 RepID=UPI000878EF02|nr:MULTISPECIES: SH3 domain-containing protein [unclassified Hydrogenophaga]MBN9373084.1 SH3 domain-containing protein [Hydrogenophaga sp.]OJV53970.1 MAG: peptide-binding protein [Hydrogenophaga sp. 70-12]QRR35986.1 SH3 domain-containing protein [Hydrogenophaga sp. YM1]